MVAAAVQLVGRTGIISRSTAYSCALAHANEAGERELESAKRTAGIVHFQFSMPKCLDEAVLAVVRLFLCPPSASHLRLSCMLVLLRVVGVHKSTKCTKRLGARTLRVAPSVPSSRGRRVRH